MEDEQKNSREMQSQIQRKEEAPPPYDYHQTNVFGQRFHHLIQQLEQEATEVQRTEGAGKQRIKEFQEAEERRRLHERIQQLEQEATEAQRAEGAGKQRIKEFQEAEERRRLHERIQQLEQEVTEIQRAEGAGKQRIKEFQKAEEHNRRLHERIQQLEQEAAEAKKGEDEEKQGTMERLKRMEDKYKKVKAERNSLEGQLVELREVNGLFAMMDLMINDSVEAYQKLKTADLTFGQIYDVCKVMNAKYDARRKENMARNLDDERLEGLYDTWLMSEEGRQMMQVWNIKNRDARISLKKWKSHIREYVVAVRDDVTETMDLYQKVFRRPHPRRGELEDSSSSDEDSEENDSA
jgi:DNA repair exonuclease SbcCD ATPase subunit